MTMFLRFVWFSRSVPAGNGLSPWLRVALAAAVLLPVLPQGALAQTNEDKGSFAVRELTLSTGYASVQLPPITLGGKLPDDVLNEDVITTGTATIDWQRVTPRTRYTLALFGTYTARSRFSRLNAPGGHLTFGLSRALGPRWRVGTGIAGAIVSANQVTSYSAPTHRLPGDDLTGAVAPVRSLGPDSTQAALFLPITQSLVEFDPYFNRILASSAEAEAAYTHSARLSTFVLGRQTTVRRLSSNADAAGALSFPDSRAQTAGMGVRYRRSERSQFTGAVNWSQASGAFTHKGISATLGYGWSGRRWFTEATVGTVLRPFEKETALGRVSTTDTWSPALVYSGAIGYRFHPQTVFVQYRRAPHDEYGGGGRNVTTGFEGDMQSLAGSWSWSSPRRRWIAQSDVSLIRRPGNFSNINAWLATARVGKHLGPHVRLMCEVLFDRHGSRGFEGFHLTRQGARVSLVWTPPRRTVE